MPFFTKKLTYKNPIKQKGLPDKFTVDIHGCSEKLGDMQSIPLFEVKDGNVIIGFTRKGDKTARAFGLYDMKAVMLIRRFLFGLHWDGKEKEVIATRPGLLKIHADMVSGGHVKEEDKHYLDCLLTKLGL